jgi:antitoxin MazE
MTTIALDADSAACIFNGYTEHAMITKLQKWGNSLGVRVPKLLAKEAGLEEGAEVELALENGKITLVPAKPKVTLRDLVARITPETLHGEIDFGKPQGREVW